MKRMTWTVKGLYDLQLATMHRASRVFCDETPMSVLDPGGKLRLRRKLCGNIGCHRDSAARVPQGS
jgi:hypothetical protein